MKLRRCWFNKISQSSCLVERFNNDLKRKGLRGELVHSPLPLWQRFLLLNRVRVLIWDKLPPVQSNLFELCASCQAAPPSLRYNAAALNRTRVSGVQPYLCRWRLATCSKATSREGIDVFGECRGRRHLVYTHTPRVCSLTMRV